MREPAFLVGLGTGLEEEEALHESLASDGLVASRLDSIAPPRLVSCCSRTSRYWTGLEKCEFLQSLGSLAGHHQRVTDKLAEVLLLLFRDN
jgi:hypothetical protein